MNVGAKETRRPGGFSTRSFAGMRGMCVRGAGNAAILDGLDGGCDLLTRSCVRGCRGGCAGHRRAARAETGKIEDSSAHGGSLRSVAATETSNGRRQDHHDAASDSGSAACRGAPTSTSRRSAPSSASASSLRRRRAAAASGSMAPSNHDRPALRGARRGGGPARSGQAAARLRGRLMRNSHSGRGHLYPARSSPVDDHRCRQSDAAAADRRGLRGAGIRRACSGTSR